MSDRLKDFFAAEVGFDGLAGEEGFAHLLVFEELKLVGMEELLGVRPCRITTVKISSETSAIGTTEEIFDA